jgi:hypothetical protein
LNALGAEPVALRNNRQWWIQAGCMVIVLVTSEIEVYELSWRETKKKTMIRTIDL